MAGQNNQNRKLQNLINIGKMADDSVGASELVDDSVGNAALGSLQEKTLLYEYDFAVSGGSAGAIALTGKDGVAPTQLPDNAVITNVTIEGVTDNTSGGSATIALGYTGQTGAFLAATAYNNAMWDVNAVTSGAPVVATGKTTAAVAVLATIATADLTAGKWYVWVTYFEGA